MVREADVVVAGAGHNSLITAAYLARAGLSVIVVDARSVAGGGAASEELLEPGFLLDSCSTGHTLIQTNPLLTRDELGLLGEQGLEYLSPDPFAHVVFPDGEQLTMWLDLERSCEELARFSKRDAAAYRETLDEYDRVKQVFSAARFNPVGYGPSMSEMLAEHPDGHRWERRRMLSAWEVIRDTYESEHVRAFFLWQAFQTYVPVDVAGTGPLAYSIVFGRQRRGWTLPRGGSGELAASLVRTIEAAGGEVLTDRKVERLVLDGDRCIGFEVGGGERFIGRQAVVSTIHVKHLIDMAPAEVWPEDWRWGIKTYDIGLSGFAVHHATSAAPVYETPRGQRSSVSSGLAGFPQQVLDYGRRMRDGIHDPEPAWLLLACPTLADPSRAPEGHHTVKLLTCAVASPPPGAASWQDAKGEFAARQLERVREYVPSLSDDAILASLVQAPPDIEAQNPHMIDGAMHGGIRSLPQAGPLQPAPGWGRHRTPLAGLYQTGGTTHPGGSITGAPGRNAARIVFEDLGLDFDAVAGGEG